MKDLSKEDEYIRQFISELGPENPPVGLQKSILERIRPTKVISYEPVISSLAWKIIAGSMVAIVISVLLFLPSGSNTLSLFDQAPEVSIPQVSFSLPNISLPVLDLSSSVIQSLVVFIILAFIATVTTLKRNLI